MISYAEAQRLFIYDPTTGVLRWRIAPSNNVSAGDVAGSPNGKGYIQVTIGDALHQGHHICFLMHFGRWPVRVDHRNRRAGDNRAANLREATAKQNSWNVAPHKRNTSGFKGVSFNKPIQKWCAYIHVNGKNKYLGATVTPEEAARLYDAAAREHYGDYAWLNNA